MSLNLKNIFENRIKGLLNRKKTLKISEEGGILGGIIGNPIDFEFGDIIIFSNPEKAAIRKEEEKPTFFFGHTFKGSSLNTGVWTESTANTGSVTVANNIVTLNAQGVNDDASIFHKINLAQNVVGKIIFEAKVRRDADAGSARCGVGISKGGIVDDLAMFRLTTGTTTWNARCENGINIADELSFTATNNTWIRVKIEITTDTAKFYLGDILKNTLTGTSVIDDQNIGIIFGVDEVSGEGCKLDIGWCKIEYGA